MKPVQRKSNGYVVCVNHGGYPASLEVWKVYRVIPSSKEEDDGFVRVIDESGEDYLYPVDLFRPIAIPADTLKVLRRNDASMKRPRRSILHRRSSARTSRSQTTAKTS